VKTRDDFLEVGGRNYGYTPALNDNPAHIEALDGLVVRHLCGRPETEALFGRLERAQRLGALV